MDWTWGILTLLATDMLFLSLGPLLLEGFLVQSVKALREHSWLWCGNVCEFARLFFVKTLKIDRKKNTEITRELRENCVMRTVT